MPRALVEQLREGGVLVLPVGTRSLQDMVVARRTPDGVVRESAGACVFVPLVGEQGWER